MENVASKKAEEERMVFRRHMALEEAERNRVDDIDIKATEKKNATDEMYNAFGQMNEKSLLGARTNRLLVCRVKISQTPHASIAIET
jgi:hypothetical protein